MAPKTSSDKLHLFFFPFMASGHQIPMLDIARIIASRGVKASILTTPQNIARFKSAIHRDRLVSGHDIDFLTLELPSDAPGLPPNCENVEVLPSHLHLKHFYRAVTTMQPQADDLVRQFQPDAIISDYSIPWTAQIAQKYGIPRISFFAMCCYADCIINAIGKHKPHENVKSDYEPFLVPGLPNPVYIAKYQMPNRFIRNANLAEFWLPALDAESHAYGKIINTVYELESEYVEHYKKITGKKVWTFGPVAMFHQKAQDMAERGNAASIDKDECLKWLDSKDPNSVIYVCFGSGCHFAESQLVEMGSGLESSNCNFIWVIRTARGGWAWLDELEERVKGRGIIIRGWAPQIMILNHPAVGGFMTHCGWNSVLEAVSSSLPMLTWPLASDHFYNESFVLNRLGIGIGIGVDTGLVWGEEEKAGALVNRDQVRSAVTRLMRGDEKVEKMRKRASELSVVTKAAVSEGGSSSVNVDRLIEDLLNQKEERLGKEREG